MRGSSDRSEGIRGWLAASARRPASWAAATAVTGSTLGGATMMFCLILPEGFLAPTCAMDFILTSIQASVLLTTLSLAGVCVLLWEGSPAGARAL